MHWLLINTLILYCSLILFAAGLSLVLAFLNVSIGLRSHYVALLIKLFRWGKDRCEKKCLEKYGPDEDESSMSVDSSQDSMIRKRKGKATPGGRYVSTRALVQEQDGYATLQEKLKTDRESLLKRKQSERKGQLDRLAEDVMDVCRWGMEVIVSDLFTESINTAELESWNLMTRQDRGYKFISLKLSFLYLLSLFIRYFVLLPVRSLIFLGGLIFVTVTSMVLSMCPEAVRAWAAEYMNNVLFRMLARAISLSATYHNPENRARPGGVCVANHTSPIDMIILGYDNYYSLVGQKHEGLLGLLETALARVSPHIWFDRFQKKDRNATLGRMVEHTQAGRAPIMIFPEGVCVNNTTVLKFRKGCFEIGCPVYPAAIKYDRLFSDPYWVEDTISEHLLHLFSSFAVKVDVYYLEPMERKESESAIQFAIRVKEAVALKGEFMGVDWDGTLKYLPVHGEVIQQLRLDYSRRVEHIRAKFEEREHASLSETSDPGIKEKESVGDVLVESIEKHAFE